MAKAWTSRRLFTKFGIIAGLAGLAAAPAVAVKFDAGDYVPAPPGTNLLLLYMQHASSDSLWANGHKIDDKARLDTDVGIFRYVGFGKVAGMTFDYQILQPFGSLRASGSTASLGSTSGVGDTILVSTLWVVNKPQSGTYVGITPYLYIPDGNYKATRALNLGENRWKGAMQGVISQQITKHWIAEGAADATFYGDNDKAPDGPLKQHKMFEFQGWARYLFDPKTEVNMRVSYTTGGDTSLDGIGQNDSTHTWSFLGTLRRSLDAHHQIMIQGGKDISVRNGFKEGMRFQVRLLQIL
ncbi:transporter [Sphingomonas abietis]|uniref:Transporter n=1 Tax=Sphingomonas abietis TaxID=3012344 RepID=A0ABY7NIV5_9SPHN|nr:transporter [Sphingomonas abietis]WBO20745.1 transporter [Sphingomonas abietis]